mgnify:CR=1 FL=1
MKLVHFRALWAGEKRIKKKGPQRKNSLLFWPKVWISPRNVEEVNWFEPNDQEGRASMLF